MSGQVSVHVARAEVGVRTGYKDYTATDSQGKAAQGSRASFLGPTRRTRGLAGLFAGVRQFGFPERVAREVL